MTGAKIPFEDAEEGAGPQKPRLRWVVWHVTQFFWPPMGGQEHLILQMCRAAADHGSRSVVVQPLTLSLLKPSSYRGRPWPPRTLLLPIPTLAPLIRLLQRVRSRLPGNTQLTPQWASDLSWRSFNWSLRTFHPMIRWWCRNATVVVHYHLHQPYFRSPRTIIFSHGVEWRRPAVTVLDQLRASSLSRVIRDPSVALILVNDRDYMNEAIRVGDAQSAQKLRLLPNPVDTTRFRPEGASMQHSHRTIVMMRNVRRDRGILEGVQAFLQFRANGHQDWQLHIYGAFSADDEYFKRCAISASVAGGAVHFHGHVASDLIPGILRRSSIALVPSQELEGTSLAALEAMAAGVPCVSTPIGGLKDISTHKSMSVRPEDIAAALIYVNANYERIRNEQMLETQRNFSLATWTLRFCEVIAEVEETHE